LRPDVFVGNDVVDLADPRTEGRSTDERFVRRVYDAEEQEAIASSRDSDLDLWSRWAAKEAGFKVISKLIGEPPPFVHRAFRVIWNSAESPTDAGVGTAIRSGVVRYELPLAGGTRVGLEATVSVALCGDALHAVGFGSRDSHSGDVHIEPHVELLETPNSVWAGPLEQLTPRLTERELDAVYSRQSAAVRLGARAALAEVIGLAQERIEIVCAPGSPGQRPPHVLVDGERVQADVSLSHDGRWIAWAIWSGR
jgi:phosphopantetheinyl transferase (holo-ACP synthase)